MKARWQTGQGPGGRQLPLATRLKRWLVERAVRDARVRRIALNRIFSGHGTKGVLCLIPFADHDVFVDPRDDRIAYSLLTGKAWQRAHLENAFGLLRQADRLCPGGVFVDVGGNIGLMTLYAMLSGHFSRGLVIEPDAWNLDILRRNLSHNGLSDRVDVVAAAASDRSGFMSLLRDARNLGAHSLEPGFSMSPEETGTAVSVEPLDAILAGRGVQPAEVGFVKIDVEGHEFAALAGMPELIAARVPVMIEVTFDARGNLAGDSPTDIERLRRLFTGYETVVDLDRPGTPRPLAHFEPSASQHELLIF